MNRPSTRLLAAMLAGLVATVVIPGKAAFADAALLSSNPADGAALKEAPVNVTLTFNEAVQSRFVKVTLAAADGAVIELPPASADQGVVTQPWPASASSGAYVLGYRIVSADGHPVAGTIRFTITSASTAPANTAPPVSSPKEAVAAGTPVAEAASDGPPVWPWLAGAAMLAGAAILFVFRRRRGDL